MYVSDGPRTCGTRGSSSGRRWFDDDDEWPIVVESRAWPGAQGSCRL